MAADSRAVTSIDWQQVCPWTHLFRAAGIALDPRKVLLATLAALLVELAGAFWRDAPLERDPARLYGAPGSAFEPTRTSAWFVNQTWSPFGGLWSIPLAGAPQDPSHAFLGRLILMLWALAVWALAGGALTRMAGLEFARQQRLSIGAALRFALGKWAAYLWAPALPLSMSVGLILLCALFGMLGSAIGDFLTGLLLCIPLVCGFLLVLLQLGLRLGWPLMWAAISVERSDGFDGMSRAYNYVYDRPGHFAGHAVAAVAWGLLLTALVAALALWMVQLGNAAVALAPGRSELSFGPGMWPNYSTADFRPAQWWLSGVSWLVVGFAHSYFWAAATILYFLLRQASDGTELHEINLVERPVRENLEALLPQVQLPQVQLPPVQLPPVQLPPVQLPIVERPRP